MNKKTLGLIAVGAIALSGVVAIPFLTAEGSTYDAVATKTQTLTRNYTFTGSVVAADSTTTFAPNQLQIASVAVETGQNVKKGDLLLTTTQGVMMKAERDGMVTAVATAGNAAYPQGSPLVTIADNSTLAVEILADEYEVAQLESGQTVDILVNALGTTIEGEVSTIEEVGQVMNGVTYYPVAITFTSSEDILLGYTAEITIEQESSANVLTVPMSALQFDDANEPYVYCGDAQDIEVCEIELGLSDGTDVEVVSGLGTNDEIFVPKAETAAESFTPPFLKNM